MWGLYIPLIVLGALFLFGVLPTLLISNVIYTKLLIRVNKDTWSRSVSWDDEEQQRMFDIGKEWGNTYEKYRKTVSIKSEGFKLVAEYFDFGYKKVAIIIPGRMESGTYSYYFSEPYRASGYNILAIDNRSHGLSEGRYNCVGLKEYKDILNWMRFAHDELKNEKVYIHGICIGSATALYALTDKNCPDYAEGMTADGMYINFKENFKNHLIERNKPLFPFTFEVMMMIALVAKKNPNKFSPINKIGRLNKPILFIYSKQDIYSIPKYGQLLYDTCQSDKVLEWFDKGAHSHVRINNTEKYDRTIKEFLANHIK